MIMKTFGKAARASNQGSMRKGVLQKDGSAKSLANKIGVLANGKSRCASCGGR